MMEPQICLENIKVLYIYIYITIFMQMTYNYIFFFQLIHHQILIINSLIVLMTLHKEWLISNNILLNTSKTTLLNLSPSPTYFPPFLIYNIVISPSPIALNLGVFFDTTLTSFLILLPSLNLQIIIY